MTGEMGEMVRSQKRDLLVHQATRWGWLATDDRPLPRDMREKLAAVGAPLPDDITTAGQLVDHLDPRGHVLRMIGRKYSA